MSKLYILGEGKVSIFGLFFKMGHSAVVWDHRAATEIIKDLNGIDQFLLRNPKGASARVRISSFLLVSFH